METSRRRPQEDELGTPDDPPVRSRPTLLSAWAASQARTRTSLTRILICSQSTRRRRTASRSRRSSTARSARSSLRRSCQPKPRSAHRHPTFRRRRSRSGTAPGSLPSRLASSTERPSSLRQTTLPPGSTASRSRASRRHLAPHLHKPAILHYLLDHDRQNGRRQRCRPRASRT